MFYYTHMANPKEDGNSPEGQPFDKKFTFDADALRAALKASGNKSLGSHLKEKGNPLSLKTPKIIESKEVPPEVIPTRPRNSFEFPPETGIIFNSEPKGNKGITPLREVWQSLGVSRSGMPETEIISIFSPKDNVLPLKSTLLGTVAGNPSAAAVVRNIIERGTRPQTPPTRR